MNYLIAFGSDPKDVTLTTSGIATAADFHRMTDELLADRRFRVPMNVLLDHTDLAAARMTDDEVKEAAESVTQLGPQLGSSRVAILAPHAATFGVSRAALALAETPRLNAKVFGVRENALRWLQRKPYLVESTSPIDRE